MTTFYLVRHGNKVTSAGDPGISDLGHLQASYTAAALIDRGISRVYTSPLARTRETAIIISESLNVPLEIEDGVRERLNWGDIPGQSFEEFLEIWDRCSREREYVPPAGISARQNGERIEQFLRRVQLQHSVPAVAVVTHGGTINDFIVNRFSSEILTNLRPGYDPVRGGLIRECSITAIHLDGECFGISTLASVEHLPPAMANLAT